MKSILASPASLLCASKEITGSQPVVGVSSVLPCEIIKNHCYTHNRTSVLCVISGGSPTS